MLLIQEKKQKQFSISSFDISDGVTSGVGGYYVKALESPVAGINADNRIGNQFKLTSIQVQLDITNKSEFTNYIDIYFFSNIRRHIRRYFRSRRYYSAEVV